MTEVSLTKVTLSSLLPPRIHRAEVVAVRRLTPVMTRVVLGGPGLADFRSTGIGDEYVRLFLPRPGKREPVLPFATDTGWDYPEGVEPGPLRTYTVRAVDPAAGTVTLDMVVHEGGIAAAWARTAAPGHIVGLNTPDSLYSPPTDMTWQLLVTDAAGLPAAARLLEQSPPGVRTRAVIEVPSPADRQHIPVHDGVEICWLYGGNGTRPSCLEQVMRSAERPSGPGYIWVAGETRVMRGVRRYLRHELRLPCTAYKVVGYWQVDNEAWMARYEALTPATRQELAAMWDSDRDTEEIQDEWTARLESLGL